MYKYFEVLRKYSSDEQSYEIVLSHGLEVLAKAIEIINKKKLYGKVDFELIISGCLLHDIGTFPFLHSKNMEGYIRHGVNGEEILLNEGMEKEALIAKRHTGSGLTREEIEANDFPLPHEDMLPLSLEEKIVCYADKFSSKNPGKKDTLETIEKEFESYGPASLRRFLQLKEMFE